MADPGGVLRVLKVAAHARIIYCPRDQVVINYSIVQYRINRACPCPKYLKPSTSNSSDFFSIWPCDWNSMRCSID